MAVDFNVDWLINSTFLLYSVHGFGVGFACLAITLTIWIDICRWYYHFVCLSYPLNLCLSYPLNIVDFLNYCNADCRWVSNFFGRVGRGELLLLGLKWLSAIGISSLLLYVLHNVSVRFGHLSFAGRSADHSDTDTFCIYIPGVFPSCADTLV